MARIRSIKPEIRRSLVVSAWPYPVRWTFVGLPGYLDDAGRGHDDVRLIKAELYPLDDDMTARKLDTHLQQIAATGPLCRYESGGRRYLHVTTWTEHQRINRPSPSRIPPCPTHELGVTAHGVLTESDVSTHGTLSEPSLPRAQAPAPAEQGAGSREQGAGKQLPRPPAAAHDGFAEFWLAYPRKIAKQKAETAYRKALKTTEPSVLLAAVRAYATQRQGEDQKFTPHPASWLNAGRWDDAPEPVAWADRVLAPDKEWLRYS